MNIIELTKTMNDSYFNQQHNENIIVFRNDKLSAHVSENKQFKDGNINYINAWYYDGKRGGLQLEKLILKESAKKGLYFEKYGKRYYINELQKEVLKRSCPNKKAI